MELDRFVVAQDPVYERVVAELRAGRKRGHWMWFVFPQLRGLGRSATAWEYGIADLTEARAYVAHPVLGPRLRECTALVNAVSEGDIDIVLGPVDALKLRSSMTLFARATEDNAVFRDTLDRCYDGGTDPLTDRLLDKTPET